jgi:hypothetical protein
MTSMCKFYPRPEEETCVCGAGSDISGAEELGVCTDTLSKECRWANEIRKEEE